jgi:hypothetical protein
MSTEQTRLQNEQKLLFLTAKQACFAVSDALIVCLNKQFKNAVKVFQLLRFGIVQQALYKENAVCHLNMKS